MERSAWGICLVVCILCGCSSSEATFAKSALPAIAKPSETAQAEEKTATGKRMAATMTHADLIRLFVDEPAPATSPLLEAHQDITFLSRLSPKEQVLYAELTNQ